MNDNDKPSTERVATAPKRVERDPKPGPWLRDGNTVYSLVHAGWRKGVEQFRNWFSAHVRGYGEVSEEELAGYAQLIVAAPDLLWALRRILGDLPTRRDWLDPATEAIARAAISKAEGRQ